jgi:hypothetical protein
MIGCPVAWKCLVAWRFGLSQQPTWSHVRHSRKCTHFEPVFSFVTLFNGHGSQWRLVGVNQESERCHHLGAFTDRPGNALHGTGSDRTSPTANTARTRVSNGRLAPPASLPVNRKPFGSRATQNPASQSVFRSALMKTNRWRTARRSSSPDWPRRKLFVDQHLDPGRRPWITKSGTYRKRPESAPIADDRGSWPPRQGERPMPQLQLPMFPAGVTESCTRFA